MKALGRNPSPCYNKKYFQARLLLNVGGPNRGPPRKEVHTVCFKVWSLLVRESSFGML